MSLMFGVRALGFVVGFALGLVLGSLISAIWLRLAARWLKFSAIPFWQAFKCALISNFVILTFNFSFGANYGLINWIVQNDNPNRNSQLTNLVFSFTPTYFLYATVLALVITATIFCRILPNDDSETRLKFGDSFALASLYFALAFACTLLLGLLAYIILTGMMAALGI